MAAKRYFNLDALMAEARRGNLELHVIFFLGPDPFELPSGVTQLEAMRTTMRVVKRATFESGIEHFGFRGYWNLGCFSVSGPVALIEAVLRQPEVVGAAPGDRGYPNIGLAIA